MKAILRRYSTLVYVLIFNLIVYPIPQAMAKSKPPGEAQTEAAKDPAPAGSDKNTKAKVVVLELNSAGSDPKAVEKVADTLRDEMQSIDGFEVVGKELTRNFFAGNPDILQRVDVKTPINRYLDQAKEFYKTMDFKDAIGLLSNTIDTYRAANPPMTEIFQMVDAYVYLGNVYMGDNQEKEAKKVFQEAVRLHPELEITEQNYPPKTVTKFFQSKEEFLQKSKPAQLDIVTNPKGAEVFVNGVSRGQAPVKLDRFSEGDHLILAKTNGYKPIARKIEIKDNYMRVRLDMEKDTQKVSAGEGLTVKDFGNIEEQVQMAGKIGSAMGVDKVVLVSLQELGFNHKITGRMIDMKYYASYKPKSVEVLDLPKDTRPAAAVIAKDLSAMAAVDLTQNPKKYADSEIIVIGKKKKKSIWKSPLLWTLLGVVVAGGATSAVLLSRGGGDGGANTTEVSVSGAAQTN